MGTPQQLGLTESSFEVLVPAELIEAPDAMRQGHVVLLVSTAPTSNPARIRDLPYAPHDYPGDPNAFGLWQRPWPGLDLIKQSLYTDPATEPYYVVQGFIVPRTSFQPLVSSVERDRELRQAMVLLVNSIYDHAQQPHPQYGACICGTSFGGLTAMATVALWPDEFQSGISLAFNPSLRNTPDDQEMYNFLCSGLGLGASGAGYTMRSAVDWNIFAQVEGVTFTSLSIVNRLFSPMPQQPPVTTPGLLRPFTFMAADEDPVTHGQDWMHLVGDSNTSGFAEPYSQRRSFTDMGNTWDVDFLVLGKTCHGGVFPNLAEPYDFPGESVPHHSTVDALWRMVHKAYEESSRPLSPLLPVNKRRDGKSPDLETLNPNDKVFARDDRRSAPSVGSLSLSEATDSQGWHRFGQGTWPGANGSMKVVTLPGDTRASIFVGSADGIVTRYQMVPTSLPGGAAIQPLVKQGESSPSLGWAVYGLDVGDLNGGNYPEVVVATYRSIFVLDPMHLEAAPLYSLDLPDWQQSQPQRLQIAEMFNGNGSPEIVFRSVYGRIVVLGISGGQLTVIGEHREPGVQDLVVGGPGLPNLPANSSFTSGYLAALGTRARGRVGTRFHRDAFERYRAPGGRVGAAVRGAFGPRAVRGVAARDAELGRTARGWLDPDLRQLAQRGRRVRQPGRGVRRAGQRRRRQIPHQVQRAECPLPDGSVPGDHGPVAGPIRDPVQRLPGRVGGRQRHRTRHEEPARFLAGPADHAGCARTCGGEHRRGRRGRRRDLDGQRAVDVVRARGPDHGGHRDRVHARRAGRRGER